MTRKKSFQNKIAGSRYSLPCSATLIALMWVAVGMAAGNIWVQFALTALSTLLMVELNNRNSLMRTYSRMVSCCFLVLATAISLPAPSLTGNMVTLCTIAFYLILWTTYQDHQATGRTFYAFVFAGIASMVCIQTAYYTPLAWILMLFFVNSFSIRTLLASLIGMALPYWFAAGYFVYTEDWQTPLAHFQGFIDYSGLLNYTQTTTHQLVNTAFIAVLALLGAVHFLRNSYADKIRTRLIYESFVVMDIVTLAFIVLMPCCYDKLIGIMVVNTAPLVAHFVTYTHTKITNIVFIAILVAAVVLLLFNLLYPETTLL